MSWLRGRKRLSLFVCANCERETGGPLSLQFALTKDLHRVAEYGQLFFNGGLAEFDEFARVVEIQ